MPNDSKAIFDSSVCSHSLPRKVGPMHFVQRKRRPNKNRKKYKKRPNYLTEKKAEKLFEIRRINKRKMNQNKNNTRKQHK